MKKITLITTILISLYFKSVAQKEIIYHFDNCVIDSLKNGIGQYQKMKKSKELKLYVVIAENNNEFEIYLQEYSHLPACGLLKVIEATNRKLEINDKTMIPIVIPSDILTEETSRDHIQFIPLSGYYVKVSYSDYKQKVIQVSNLF